MNSRYFILTMVLFLNFSCSQTSSRNGQIQYNKVQLSPAEIKILSESLESMHERYDPKEKMLTQIITGWHLAQDVEEGIVHSVRASFNYAVALLDVGDEQYTQRAFDIIEKTITLQDQDTTSKSSGVWPYYLEEPFATKKSKIDYNWADFNAVSLLDVWMGHQERIPENLKNKIKKSLILAAKSIQKRNVGPGYTNIAIMGTYVTYMVSHLFDISEMKEYAHNRLQIFYDYTLKKGGFTEYNSPTYTIVALDELNRMQRHIIHSKSKQMIDSLYSIGWEMIARHYHQPTGQWSGPHSRSYSTLISPSFYGILNEASNGKLKFPAQEMHRDVKIKHKIPDFLMCYFLSPEYPRTELDTFEINEPKTIGTSYLTEMFALSTANRSSLWIQRRPFLVYWGNINKPKYIQVRFLKDNYDFSSATFFSQQKENKVLAGINFNSNGGDRHITGDRLKDGKFMAKDLRLRFELGNVSNTSELMIPNSVTEPFCFNLDQIRFNFQLYYAEFEDLDGHWEKGGDGNTSWIDFIFYSGVVTEFDLTKISSAVSGFTFTIDKVNQKQVVEKADFVEKEGIMKVMWNGMKLEIPIKPQTPENIFI